MLDPVTYEARDEHVHPAEGVGQRVDDLGRAGQLGEVEVADLRAGTARVPARCSSNLVPSPAQAGT